jgi:hypothetical protein
MDVVVDDVEVDTTLLAAAKGGGGATVVPALEHES